MTKKMRNESISHARHQYDADNVCTSIGRTSCLEQVPKLVARAADITASDHRIVLACVLIKCFDGSATFLLRQGVQTGDTHAVECFRRTFTDMVIVWEADRLRNVTSSKIRGTTRQYGQHVDTGVPKSVATQNHNTLFWKQDDVKQEKKQSALMRTKAVAE